MGLASYPMAATKPLTSERVQEMLDDLGVTQTELAKAAGCTKGLVNQWLSGETKRVGQDYAHKLEARYGYSSRWIRYGEPPKRVDDATRRVLEAMARMSPSERQRIARMIAAAKDES